MSADPRTDRRLRDANGDLVSLGTVRTDPPTPDPLYGPAATARVHAKLDKAHCFVTNCRLPQHLAVERRSGNDRRAALPFAPDQRLREAIDAIERMPLYDDRDRIVTMAGDTRELRTMADAAEAIKTRVLGILAALSEATTSPEATLDGEMEWLDPRHRQWSRENIARNPDARFPYKAILPLIDALDTLAARLRGPA